MTFTEFYATVCYVLLEDDAEQLYEAIYSAGEQQGHEIGYDAGYEDGYEDGYYDAGDAQHLNEYQEQVN